MEDNIQPLIGPYESTPAVCRDYDPCAVSVAQQIAACIASRFPQVCVEHVGSTSVPDCAGKGIVDLLIVASDDELEEVKETLDELGFQKQPHRDPFPESRPMRVSSVLHEGKAFMLHVHVVPADSHEVDEMLFFRACLRADPELRKAYISAKRKIIANGATDSLRYCDEKGKFIKEVLG